MFFEVKDLVVHYGRKTVLRGISLNCRESEIVTLIGANGAGKSTILRTVSGLKELTSGEVWMEDRKISGLSPYEIVGLGIAQVPEGRHVFPYMKVGENLRMGAFLRKDKKEIRRDLEAVYGHFPILRERSRQDAGSLSGGEQQMLTMGRAMMARPRLLLLDEPSLGLSPIMVKEISKAVVEIREKREVSIILVEQNARLALKIANRGYVLETGRIALEDDAQKLAHNEHVIRIYLGG